MAEPSHNTSQNHVIPFAFEGLPIRTTIRNGEPWFVASDVCRALDIANHRDAIDRLDDDEKGVALTDTLGGNQGTNIINESGLYTIVLRCRDAVNPGTLPHRFRKWVTSEVLPAIRKTGQYASKPMTEDGLTLEAMKALARTRFMVRIDPFDGNQVNIMPLSSTQRLVDTSKDYSIREAIQQMDKQAISVVYEEIGRVLLTNARETVTFTPKPVTQPATREQRAIRALLRVMPPGVDVGRTRIVNAVKGTLNASEIDDAMSELKSMGVIQERRSDPDGPGRPPVFYRRVG